MLNQDFWSILWSRGSIFLEFWTWSSLGYSSAFWTRFAQSGDLGFPWPLKWHGWA